jgi:hypothetical protein
MVRCCVGGGRVVSPKLITGKSLPLSFTVVLLPKNKHALSLELGILHNLATRQLQTPSLPSMLAFDFRGIAYVQR